MSLHQGSKISTKGLVFAYDQGDPLIVHNNPRAGKSWRGKPMTNNTSNWTSYSNWNNSGTATWNNNDTTIPRLHPDFPVISMTKGDAGNSHISTGNGSISSGNYTSSVWIYIPGSNGASIAGSSPYFRSYPANTGRGTLISKDGDTGFNVPRDKWVRISATWNNTASDTSMYISCYLNNTGDKVYFTMPQLEANDFVTPHINAQTGSATRSSTTSLLDWTGNQTITTNATYNSDGTFKLNSSNPDYLDLGSDKTIKTSGGWTVESWVKYDTVPAGYDNVNSPGNFIGSDTISYNSWYWSVLSSKLALWNISPGTWRYGSTTLQANTWYHAVLVCASSGTSYQMYLNGVAEGGDHTTYTSWSSSHSGLKVRYMGRGNSSNTRRLNGSLPVTRFYDRPLTAEEVLSNYNAHKDRFS